MAGRSDGSLLTAPTNWWAAGTPLILQTKTHFLPKVGRYTDGIDVRCHMTTFLVNIMKFTVCLEQQKCFFQPGRRIWTEWKFPSGLHLRTVPHWGCWLGGQGHIMLAPPTKSGGVKMCYTSETSPKPLEPQWVWWKLTLQSYHPLEVYLHCKFICHWISELLDWMLGRVKHCHQGAYSQSIFLMELIFFNCYHLIDKYPRLMKWLTWDLNLGPPNANSSAGSYTLSNPPTKLHTHCEQWNLTYQKIKIRQVIWVWERASKSSSLFDCWLMAKWNTGVPYLSFSRFGAQNIDTFSLLKIFEWWYVTGITSNRNLVCLGWYSKIPQTGWLAKDRNLVFTILDPVSLRSGGSEGEFWRQCSQGCRGPTSCCVLTW